MIIVVCQVFVAGNLPSFFNGLKGSFEKCNGYSFENIESVERFVKGCQLYISSLHTKAHYEVVHNFMPDQTGVISICRVGKKCPQSLMSMRYIIPRGHVCVSRDGMSLYQYGFMMKEEKDV